LVEKMFYSIKKEALPFEKEIFAAALLAVCGGTAVGWLRLATCRECGSHRR
jgi:hypothetical protein